VQKFYSVNFLSHEPFIAQKFPNILLFLFLLKDCS